MSISRAGSFRGSLSHFTNNEDAAPFQMGVGDVYFVSLELEIVRFAIRWPKSTTGLCDVTVSAVVFSNSGKKVDHVTFGRKASSDKAILKDTRSKGDTNEEYLTINLASITEDHSFVFIVLNVYTLQKSFNDVHELRCRVIEMKRPPTDVAIYKAGTSSKFSGMIHSLLYRNQKQWHFLPLGMFAEGRTFKDLLPVMEDQVRRLQKFRLAPNALNDVNVAQKTGGKVPKGYTSLANSVFAFDADTQSDSDNDTVSLSSEGRMIRRKEKTYSNGRSVKTAFIRNLDVDVQSSSSDEDELLSILPNHSVKTVVRYDAQCYNVGSRYPALKDHVEKFRGTYTKAAAEEAKRLLEQQSVRPSFEGSPMTTQLQSDEVQSPPPNEAVVGMVDPTPLPPLVAPDPVVENEAPEQAAELIQVASQLPGLLIQPVLPRLKKKVQSNEERLAALMQEMSAARDNKGKAKRKPQRQGIKTNLSSMLASLL